MIYPITDRTILTVNNQKFKRYAIRYLDIEQQTQQAIIEYGLNFEAPFAEQHGIEKLKLSIKNHGATFANNGKSMHCKWLS
ncbi:hypothetical protein, partial [Vibrio sp. Vb0877]|uniref:hypothetical protein n=1 Tax=Vibrio sp. Vb0877 TaxID=2816073 RepID=UPI001A8D54E6